MNTVYSNDNRYKFEVISDIPNNYTIWNVNKNVIKGYVPLVQLSKYQPFPGGRNIDTETMKAIKCENYAEIMDNLYLLGSVKKTELFFKKHENNNRKQWEINRIKKSLPLIKKLKGWENIID